jgi:hypothetical protein
MRTAFNRLPTLWFVGLLVTVLCACQPEKFALIRVPELDAAALPITKSADPSTLQMPYHAQWQERCNGGLWPGFLSQDLPQSSGYFMPGMEMEFADPALAAFLRNLTRSLCAPVQPYKSTLRYSVEGNEIEYVIETLSAHQYYIQPDKSTPCVRNFDKAYQRDGEGWREFINLDTPACDHPLQVIILLFLQRPPQSSPIAGQLIVEPQQMYAGRLTNVYTIASELEPIAGSTRTQTMVIQVWLGAQSGQPVHIEFLAVGAFPHMHIDFEHGIPLSVAFPPARGQ